MKDFRVPSDSFSLSSSGSLRVPENPESLFSADPLMMLRLLLASSEGDLPLEANADRALRREYPLLLRLLPAPLSGGEENPEAVFSLLLSLLCGPGAGRILREYTGLFTLLLPPLIPAVGYDQQNPHHLYTVFEHTVRAVENVPPLPLLRFVMLLHDTGKPLARTTDEKGIGHYKGHQKISACLAGEVMEAYHCDRAFRDQVELLVGAHDIPLSPDPASLERRLAQYGEENLRLLFLIHCADRIATGTRNPNHARERSLELSHALDRLLEAKKE